MKLVHLVKELTTRAAIPNGWRMYLMGVGEFTARPLGLVKLKDIKATLELLVFTLQTRYNKV